MHQGISTVDRMHGIRPRQSWHLGKGTQTTSEYTRTNKMGDASFDPLSFKLPGQHVYRGVAFQGGYPVEQLREVENLQFTADDVIVASYPKTG